MFARSCVVSLLLTGCFAEITGGYYKSSGSSEESEFLIGFNAGVYLEYSRFIRVAAGGDAVLPLGSGDVRQRAYGTTVKGDVTLIGDPKNRLRASGGVLFGQGGQTSISQGANVARLEGTNDTDGWFAGLTFETTTGVAKDRVTQSYTLGYHALTTTSDVLGERTLQGVQLRINHTFWPTYRQVSPGFLGALANMMVNNSVAGRGMATPTGACYTNTERVLSFGGWRKVERDYCN